MTSKTSQIAHLEVQHSHVQHLLDEYIFKEQMRCEYYDKAKLAIEKQKNDIKWRKRHDELLDEWRRLC